MRRPELLRVVTAAAREADLLDTDLDTLIAKLSDASVTRVAAGVWDYVSENCMCPATLAFGEGAENNQRFVAFAEAFDHAVEVDGGMGQVRVIEIEDGTTYGERFNDGPM